MADIIENIEILQILRNRFLVTGDMDYLDNAIGMAEATIATCHYRYLKHQLRSLMSSLLESKSKRKGIGNAEHTTEFSQDILSISVGLAHGSLVAISYGSPID